MVVSPYFGVEKAMWLWLKKLEFQNGLNNPLRSFNFEPHVSNGFENIYGKRTANSSNLDSTPVSPIGTNGPKKLAALLASLETNPAGPNKRPNPKKAFARHPKRTKKTHLSFCPPKKLADSRQRLLNLVSQKKNSNFRRWCWALRVLQNLLQSRLL